MSNIYWFKRLIRRYENGFSKKRLKIYEEKDFHIEQLRTAIDCVNEVLDTFGDEIHEWAKTISEVNEVDDCNTWMKKVELSIMKKYVNFRYSHACKEAEKFGKVYEKLNDFLNRLLVMKSFNNHLH